MNSWVTLTRFLKNQSTSALDWLELAKLPERDEVMRSVAGILSPEAYDNGVRVGVEKCKGETLTTALLNQLVLKFGPLSA